MSRMFLWVRGSTIPRHTVLRFWWALYHWSSFTSSEPTLNIFTGWSRAHCTPQYLGIFITAINIFPGIEQHDVMSQIHQFYDLLSPFKSVILVHKELRLRMEENVFILRFYTFICVWSWVLNEGRKLGKDVHAGGVWLWVSGSQLDVPADRTHTWILKKDLPSSSLPLQHSRFIDIYFERNICVH